MNRDELMRRIQALAFAKAEAELFLDTHPECVTALDYYHKIADELNLATEEYQSAYGPIVAEASSRDRWNWVDTPWPWQEMDAVRGKNGMGGKR